MEKGSLLQQYCVASLWKHLFHREKPSVLFFVIAKVQSSPDKTAPTAASKLIPLAASKARSHFLFFPFVFQG